MPIPTFSLWQDFQSENNVSQNGWFRPETDFIRGVNVTSIKFWNKYTAIAERSQEAKDKLFPFQRSKNIVVNSASGYYGFAKKPDDYGRLASIRIVVHKSGITCPSKAIDDGKCDDWQTKEEFEDDYLDHVTEYRAEIIQNQNWASFCEHLTKGPKLDRPGVTQINEGFQVAPRKVSVIALNYYINPSPATFKYTIAPGNPQTGAGDQIIFDTSSAPIPWPEQMRQEFLEELKDWYILYIRDQVGNQISNSQKQLQR